MRTVYLGGPIVGCTKDEANDWRDKVTAELAFYDIKGISPLRCEPIVGATYSAVYDDARFGSARAITSKNYFDVKNCDMMIAYFPYRTDARLSLGTIAEMSWAFALGKPAIVVTRDARILGHPVLQHTAGWTLDNLDEAVDVAVGILGDYSKRSA